MASVNWTKMKTVQQVKAVLRHDCKDTRQDAKTHTNEDLNKDLTGQNYGFGDMYDDAQKAFTDRLKAVTAGKVIRKDAVVGVGFSIPAPADLPQDKEKDWFKRVYEVLGDTYGKDNICCFAVHVDEQHEYIDPDSKESRMSRSHAQGVMVPETGGRLCAKDFVSRGRMIAINNAIDKMSQEEFGVKFMDGSQAKSRGSVETLKQRSARLQIDKDLEEARQEAQRVAQEAAAKQQTITDSETALAAREAAVAARETAATEKEHEILQKGLKLAAMRQDVTRREAAVTAREKAQEQKEADFQVREDALEAQKRALETREQKTEAIIKAGRIAMAEDKFRNVETQTTRQGRALPDYQP